MTESLQFKQRIVSALVKILTDHNICDDDKRDAYANSVVESYSMLFQFNRPVLTIVDELARSLVQGLVNSELLHLALAESASEVGYSVEPLAIVRCLGTVDSSTTDYTLRDTAWLSVGPWSLHVGSSSVAVFLNGHEEKSSLEEFRFDDSPGMSYTNVRQLVAERALELDENIPSGDICDGRFTADGNVWSTEVQIEGQEEPQVWQIVFKPSSFEVARSGLVGCQRDLRAQKAAAAWIGFDFGSACVTQAHDWQRTDVDTLHREYVVHADDDFITCTFVVEFVPGTDRVKSIGIEE